MTRLLGAALVALSGGGLGFAAVRSADCAIGMLEETIGSLLRMREEICLDQLPIPEALGRMLERSPGLFGPDGAVGSVSDRPLLDCWKELFTVSELTEDAKAPILALGEALADGAEPEGAFDRCLEELRTALESRRQRREKNAQAYIGCGLAAGAMLSLLLL